MINIGNANDEEEFFRRNITFKEASKPEEPELTSAEELMRFLMINLICIVSIMMMMTFCYLSHIVYNNLWKPTMKQRRDKAERCKLAKENENNKMVVDRRFDKEKELASKSAQPEQIENMI